MIQLQGVSLYRGSKCLFENASLLAHPGWHLALTGRNGCGKSSLFELLLGQATPDQGDCSIPPNLRIAHMAQEVAALDESALNYVLGGDEELVNLHAQLDAANASDAHHRIGQLHEQLDNIDAWTAESRASQLLAGLGFLPAQISEPVKSFSGGWRMRLNLARTLMCRSDLLLLDEPTNHLDLDAILWLESWLQRYPGTLIVISHDRDFLDEVTQHVLHIEHQTLTLYRGNYSEFEVQRAAHLAAQQAAFEKQEQQRAHLEAFVRRFKAKASKARQAQSRVKALERLQLSAPAHSDSPFRFSIASKPTPPGALIELENASLGYGKNPIFAKLNLTLYPGDRLGLIGPNGAGKSTLIKGLIGQLEPATGRRHSHEAVQLGYFAQHQLDQLDLDATPLLTLQRIAQQTREVDLRTYLGRFGFIGDDVNKPINQFSGGEKSRLALAEIIWHQPNVLMLDEPTNHLDMEMRMALTLALQDYAGALILVSHDRHLLRSTTDQFWLVANGGAQPFDGDLDDYGRWLADFRQQQAGSKSDSTAPSVKASSPPDTNNQADKKAARQEAAALRERLRPLKRELNQVERALDKANAVRSELETALASPEAYADANKAQLSQWLQQQADNEKHIATLEEQWMDLSETLQQLENGQ